MRNKRLIVSCIFCSIVINLYALAGANAGAYEVVRNVIDGDTVVLSDNTIVRLAFIDAPELQYKKAKRQYYAIQAKQFLADRVQGKQVSLEITKKADRYNRVIAKVKTADGVDIGSLLVQQGMAFVYPHKDGAQNYLDHLVGVQRKAMKDRKGFWHSLFDYFSNSEKVVGNKRSKRFFPDSCKAWRSIAKRNRVSFSSAIEAFRIGYAPARNCTIWPE